LFEHQDNERFNPMFSVFQEKRNFLNIFPYVKTLKSHNLRDIPNYYQPIRESFQEGDWRFKKQPKFNINEKSEKQTGDKVMRKTKRNQDNRRLTEKDKRKKRMLSH
jgi:hypothetical protein